MCLRLGFQSMYFLLFFQVITTQIISILLSCVYVSVCLISLNIKCLNLNICKFYFDVLRDDQTVLTIFRYCRDQVTQTKKDNYSNVPKPQVFLAGLRGGGMKKPTEMTKTDLTIDVDQT